MTLSEVREVHPGKYNSWLCDGKKYQGCKGDFKADSVAHNVPGERLYHCEECSFDFCVPCFQAYPDSHNHEMVPTTFAELSKKEAGYATGWLCDARKFKQPPCENKGSAVTDIVYHDGGCFFDLCEECVNFYNPDK